MDPHQLVNPLGQRGARTVVIIALSRRAPTSVQVGKSADGSHLISSSEEKKKTNAGRSLESQQGYRFLEHVTDALAEAWGTTIEGAFIQAGLALFDTMLDPKSVKPIVIEEIEAIGHDEKELLYNFLEELLLLFELKQFAVKTIKVTSTSKTPGNLKLKSHVSGERYDPKKHRGKVEIKGITYHLMEIEKRPEKTTVRFLLDL